MADDRLVIAAAVDPAGVSRGLAQAVRAVEGAAGQMQRAVTSFNLDPAALVPRGLPAALAEAGEAGGEALAAGIADGIQVGAREGSAALAGLRASIDEIVRLAGAIDAAPPSVAREADAEALRQLLAEEQQLARATEGARQEATALASALLTMNEAGDRGAAVLSSVVRQLERVQAAATGASRTASQASPAIGLPDPAAIEASVSAAQGAAREIATVLSGVGDEAGASIAAGIATGVETGAEESVAGLADLRASIAEIARLAAEVQVGGGRAREDDVKAIHALIAEQRELARATEGADAEVIALSRALQTMNDGFVVGSQSLRSVVTQLSDVDALARRITSAPPVGATLAGLPDPADVAASTAAVRAAADEVVVSADQERAARAAARKELVAQIPILALYARTVDATSAEAVAAWREEAAAIQAQAAELGLSREAMLRLEATVQQTEERFARLAAAENRATVAAIPLVAKTGAFTETGRQAANAAIGLGFALQAMATDTDTAEGKLRSALSAVSALGLAFGPKGLLIAGLAQATIAIIDWTNQTEEAEERAERYADELKHIEESASLAAGAVRDLTAAQAAKRQLTLTDDLRQAQEDVAKFREELLKATEPAGVLGSLFQDAAERSFNSLIASSGTLREDFAAGRINAEQYGAAIAAMANDAAVGNDAQQAFARTLVAQADQLQAAEERATALGRALRGLPSAIRQPGAPIRTDIADQIADQEALNDAFRRGGEIEHEAVQTAIRAFDEWKRSQGTAVDAALTFSDALHGQDAAAREQAEALLRDARALVAMGDAADQAAEQLRKAEEARRKFLEQASAPVLRLDVATTLSAGELDESERAALLRGIVEAQARVTAEIERQGGANAKNIAYVEELLRTLEQLRAATRVDVVLDLSGVDRQMQQLSRTLGESLERTTVQVPIDIPGSASGALAELRRQAEALQRATADVDLAKLAGDPAALDAARARYTEIRDAVEVTERAVAAFGAALPDEQRVAFLEQIRKIFADLGLDIDAAADGADGVTKALRTVATGARGLLQIADAAGQVNEDFRRAADGATGLLSSVADVREALAKLDETGKGIGALFGSASGLSSVVGAIGGAVSLFQGIKGLLDGGPSPIAEALDRNREALDRMSHNLDAFRPTFANLAQVQAQASTIATNPALREPGFLGAVGVLDGARLARALAGVGTTFEELQEIAEGFGLTLQDADGRALAQGFRDLADAMDILREQALTLGDSFGDLQQASSVRLDLFNLDSPVDAWNEVVRQAEQLLPKQIADQFASFDVDTDAGREAAEGFLQRLFTQGQSGQLLDVLKGSGFESIGEFFEFLAAADDPLDRLRESSDDAADALSALADINLPAGFRREFPEWASTLPEATDALQDLIQTAPAPSFIPPEPAPAPSPSAGRDRTSTGDDEGRVRVEHHYHYAAGAIVVQAADRPASEIYDDVEREGRRRARNRGGHRAATQYAR